MAELCRIYGIARKTGYEWVERYKAEGLGGLQDRRYGAGSHPNQTEAGMEEQILQLKFAHPSWGAKKLHGHLWAKRKGVQWPVVSTFGEILRRAGLCTPQRKRLRIPVYSKPFEKVEKANQVCVCGFQGLVSDRQGRADRSLDGGPMRTAVICCAVRVWPRRIRSMWKRCSQPRFANTECRSGSEPIMELRLLPGP